MENYEKLYKEALERAKYLKENTDSVGAKDISYNFEYIFPELRESEDEKIRKAMIKYFEDIEQVPTVNGFGRNEFLAWLEKQAEQKPADSYCQENCKGFKETGKCFADGDCKAKRDAEQNSLKIYAKQWRSKP